MISLRQINNEIVRPIKIPIPNLDKIKGHELFEETYANIFLLAKKKSGKTNTIFKILKETCGRNTSIVIFSSTVFKDKNWEHIVNYFQGKNRHIEQYTAIKENKINHVQELLKGLQHETNEEPTQRAEKPKQEPNPKLLLFDFEEKEIVKPTKKDTKLSPEFIFIFDDVGNELQDKYVSQLLKTNRHYKSKVIISSQYLHDLTPQSRKQLDYMLIYRGQPMEKLQLIHKDLDIATDFDTFLQLYQNATKEKFCFLYVDVRKENFRKCFDQEYFLE